MKPFTKILCPIDFSTSSDKALQAALDLAARYDASLTLLYVHEPLPLVFPEGTGIYQTLQLPDLTEEMRKQLERKKQEASAKAGRPLEALQLHGYPPREIAELAKKNGYDLIVMGTHGRRGFSHAMIGSVAERTVRTAPCPVLVINERTAA